MAIPYKITPHPIDKGLDNKKLPSDMDYLIILSSPPDANIRVRVDETGADEIPLEEKEGIEVKKTSKVYLSCDPIVNGEIVVAQSDSMTGFKIITAPTIKDIQMISKVDQIGDTFTPSDTVTQETVITGGTYDLDITGLNAVRFHSSDEIGVELGASGLKYPMFEDIIHTRNLTQNIKFHNDNENDLILTIWRM